MENKEQNQDVQVKDVQKPLTFIENLKKQILGIEFNKKFIADFFINQKKANKTGNFKAFVVRSKDKERANYYEIFFDFGALNLFAQKEKNLSINKDKDLLDENRETKDYFKQMFYEVYEVVCVDLGDRIFDLQKSNEKQSLEMLESVKK